MDTHPTPGMYRRNVRDCEVIFCIFNGVTTEDVIIIFSCRKSYDIAGKQEIFFLKFPGEHEGQWTLQMPCVEYCWGNHLHIHFAGCR